MKEIQYFPYGEKELTYLKTRDKKLGAYIDMIGWIPREVDSDLFDSVIHQIIGQQISTKAQETIYRRLHDILEEINADTILAADANTLQSVGLTYHKVEYMQDFARRVKNGEIDLDALKELSDEEVIRILSSLKGIGTWTAEMLMLFCMQRTDILSYDDLAIHRGLRMVYRHRNIDKRMFERYRKRYSPYGSIASFYLWAIATGAVPGLTDPKPKKKR